MAPTPTIIIAGAGIGGLSAALALAQAGFRVRVLEQAARLEEAGAGIQLSSNATRILIGLGLKDRLLPRVVAPECIRVRRAADGRDIARIPVGHSQRYYGAPYWVIHRGDLHAALLRGLDRRISQETRFPVYVSEDPLLCVVRGAGEVLEEQGLLQKVQSQLASRRTGR